MSTCSTIINAISYVIGASGAIMLWLDSRHFGSGVGAYASEELLKQIASLSRKSVKVKDYSMLLIAISFVMQFVALFV